MSILRALFTVAISVLLYSCATLDRGLDQTQKEPKGGLTQIRAMTYNIRLDIASDGLNAWAYRKAMVADIIRYEAPDIIGMQEVLLNQKHDLETALPTYIFVGAGRDDGKEGGEFSPLAWRGDRFEEIESGTFWLSPTPSLPSKGWDAAYPRIASWALLRDRESGRIIRVLNTHFDHIGEDAKRKSAQIIADWVQKYKADHSPLIVMGDFNSTPDSEPFSILTDTGQNIGQSGLRDARQASLTPPYGPRGTFNAFRIDSAATDPIDHIFVSNNLIIRHYAVITQHWEGHLPSDHYPVIADMTLNSGM